MEKLAMLYLHIRPFRIPSNSNYKKGDYVYYPFDTTTYTDYYNLYKSIVRIDKDKDFRYSDYDITE